MIATDLIVFCISQVNISSDKLIVKRMRRKINFYPCQAPACTVNRATYGFKDVGTLVRCSKHKVEGMVKLYARLCEDPSCGTRPSFGYEGDKKAKRCTKHKEDGMIDLVHKVCKDLTCNRRASYGYEADKQLVRCKKHIEENMVLLTGHKCEHPTCETRATLGDPSTNVSDT
jgi:EsV-1-7 cysteine-rich motif